jgi:uncharacterized protein YodC (DUF2158 family)
MKAVTNTNKDWSENHQEKTGSKVQLKNGPSKCHKLVTLTDLKSDGTYQCRHPRETSL